MHKLNLNEIGLYVFFESTEKKTIYKEKLVLPDKQVVDLDFLSLINAIFSCNSLPRRFTIQDLLHMFYEKIDPEINKYLDDQIKSVSGDPLLAPLINALNGSNNPELFENIIKLSDILEDVLQPPQIDSRLIGFYGEAYFIDLAIKKWLIRVDSKEMPLERYSSVWATIQNESHKDVVQKAHDIVNMLINLKGNNNDVSSLLLEKALYKVLETRNKEVHQELRALEVRKKVIRSRERDVKKKQGVIITKDTQIQYVSSKYYISKYGFLPLLWSEITYCIENNLLIKQCKECNKWFHVNSNEKYCSGPCQQQSKKRQDDERYLAKREENKNAQETRK
jgi:hypothetical protein